MKKLFILPFAICLLTSCGAKTDSAETTEAENDTLAATAQQPVVEETIVEEVAEEPVDTFANSIPAAKSLLKENKKVDAYLKSLGYEGSYRKIKGVENNYASGTTGSYTLEVNGKTCKVVWYEGESADSGCYDFTTEVTITGDADALAKFYKDAKKQKPKDLHYESYFDVDKKGDKVIINTGGC